MLKKVERLISEINRIHKEYSRDYFETGKVKKLNLKHTFAKVPTQPILAYRLNLHEAINDYLMKADLKDISYVYRVKTSESILDKIDRYSKDKWGKRKKEYPIKDILDDIFGIRIILKADEIESIKGIIDEWKKEYHFEYRQTKKARSLNNKYGYQNSLVINFEGSVDYDFSWELQIWDESYVDSNIDKQKKFFSNNKKDRKVSEKGKVRERVTEKKHKVVFLVGNGFDINVLTHLGSKKGTSYKNFYYFIKYTYPTASNLLLEEMDKRKDEGEKNWSNFEEIISELTEKNNEEQHKKLEESLREFQTYFSEFLNDVVSLDILKKVDNILRDAKHLNLPQHNQKEQVIYGKNFFYRTLGLFLRDLDDKEEIKRTNLFKELKHHDILDFKFVNFNYTSLLDGTIFLDKDSFNPSPARTNLNNFDFKVPYATGNSDRSCQLQTEIIHPHGFQDIPRSILFGHGRNEEHNPFSKPYWAMYDEKYTSLMENASLYVIYGHSLGETDRWWWDKIVDDILYGNSQVMVYNFKNSLGDKKTIVEKLLGDRDISKEQKEKVKRNTFVVTYCCDRGFQPVLFNFNLVDKKE